MTAMGSEDTFSLEVDEIMVDGDLVLVIGPDKKRLRVHSLFLGIS
jgi:hypothetical protein